MAQDAGLAAIVNLVHVPFGNQYFATATCGGGPYSSTTRHCWCKACVEAASPAADCFGDMSTVVSQHGPDEYATNRGQTCAKSLTSGDASWATHYWPFVVCTEAALAKGQAPATFLGACATSAGVDLDKFNDCFSNTGDDLVRAAAKATFDHQGTPWVLVNGVQTDPTGLIQAVCDAYTGSGGTAPSGCSSSCV